MNWEVGTKVRVIDDLLEAYNIGDNSDDRVHEINPGMRALAGASGVVCKEDNHDPRVRFESGERYYFPDEALVRI